LTPSSVPPPVTAVIDSAGAWLPLSLGEVERQLDAVIGGHGPKLAEDAGQTLRAGGKRLRPLLVLLCAGAEGGEAAVRAGTATELIHMATLIHDDVLDDAPLRRGRPTVYAQSGREAAISVGDLLFSRAFHLLGAAGDGEAIRLLSRASVALARGELAQRADAFDTEISEGRYFDRCRLKTAALFECACLLGLNARSGEGGPDEATANELRSFGGEIGLAFQLFDDVLDVSGPPERTGKARGTDLLDGTVTLPLILARRAAEEEPDALDGGVVKLLTELDLRALDAAAAERVCDAIAATGALEEVRQRALDMVARAKARLAGDGVFEPEQARLLGLVADGVVERYS
jgi:geranylgeranyl pyrophosphate synthase